MNETKQFSTQNWLLIGIAVLAIAAFGCGSSDDGTGGTGGTGGTAGTGGGSSDPCADTFPNGIGAYAAELDMCFLVQCDDGFADCDGGEENGCEVATSADVENCGTCGNACALVGQCSAGTCDNEAGTTPATWKVTSLGSDDCAGNPLHEGFTGDDRGGIATTANIFFYSGDDFTGGFDAITAAATTVRGDIYDGIFSDLATGRLYNFTSGGDLVIDTGCDLTFDGFQEIDPTTLMPVGDIVALDTDIAACAGLDERGMFSGMGVVLVHDGTNTFEVSLSDGAVTDLGAGADLTGATGCENWAIWGFAERFGGDTYMVFRLDSAGENAIVRRKVADGTTETILDLGAIELDTGGTASDMCSIGLNPARATWVYHAEDIENMLGIPDVDSEEAVGVCPAVIEAPAN